MLTPLRKTTSGARRQHGLTIVELMIGLTIGLIIATAAALLVAANLRESRQLLVEARLMQELRTTADLIARDLRRVGYWAAAEEGVALFGATSVRTNPYAMVGPAGAASDAIGYGYSRDDGPENHVVDSNERMGFRLRAGAIDRQAGPTWGPMTDAATLKITEFNIVPSLQTIDLAAYCATPCESGATGCPPQQQIRSFSVTIGGQLASDPGVTRSLRSNIRLRNDTLVGACAD